MSEEATATKTTAEVETRKPSILFTILGLPVGAGAGLVLDGFSMTTGAGIGLIVGLGLDFLRRRKQS